MGKGVGKKNKLFTYNFDDCFFLSPRKKLFLFFLRADKRCNNLYERIGKENCSQVLFFSYRLCNRRLGSRPTFGKIKWQSATRHRSPAAASTADSCLLQKKVSLKINCNKFEATVLRKKKFKSFSLLNLFLVFIDIEKISWESLSFIRIYGIISNN